MHRGGGDMVRGGGLKVCNSRRKELPATGEVVTVEVEVKITKWPRAKVKAYIFCEAVFYYCKSIDFEARSRSGRALR